MAVYSPRRKKRGRHADPSGYGSEPVRSRPGYRYDWFNPKAIEALGLSPIELAQRGYPLDGDVIGPAIMPKDGPVSAADDG
jgi:hypothetical protein